MDYMDQNAVATLLGALGAFSAVFLVLAIVMIVANWRIFTKAGEAGWKCLIPVYNEFVAFKLFWQAKFFWMMIGASVVCAVLNVIGAQFESGSAATVIFAILAGIVSIAGAVIGIIKMHKMSVSFGHGIGFTLGLIFLNPIFVLILAFGSSEYQGAQD